MREKLVLSLLLLIMATNLVAQQTVPQKPRIIISSDIGGTDPDDNQSVAHFLMYNNEFDTEGLISSPSFGNGDKKEILRMIERSTNVGETYPGAILSRLPPLYY